MQESIPVVDNSQRGDVAVYPSEEQEEASKFHELPKQVIDTASLGCTNLTSMRTQADTVAKQKSEKDNRSKEKRKEKDSTGQKSSHSGKDKTRNSGKKGVFLGQNVAADAAAHAAILVDASAMKERVREKLSKKKTNVTDYYHDTGVCQAIARSQIFDKLTLTVIAVNAIWIAIDTDMNHATLLLDAETVFVFAENFFCTYFVFEWVVRFISFRNKLDGRKDAWFVFDSFMVMMMVLETWVFTVIILFLGGAGGGGAGGAGNVSILRLARLLRLTRMARMGKLLRVLPELLIMLKGMIAATRSVFWTLFLLFIIMYIFGILFVQLGDGTDVGRKYFDAVPTAMYNLLLFGIFLDDIAKLTSYLQDEWLLSIFFFLFVLLGAFTVMNMLIGVLCEVVSAVASAEKEEIVVNYVNDKISQVVQLLDQNGDGTISKDEFAKLLDNTEAVRCLNDVGVDVFALIDLTDYIFQDEMKNEVELDFERFMETVLQLRGSNTATVKDIVDLRKFMRRVMQDNRDQTTRIRDSMQELIRHSQQLHFGLAQQGFADSVMGIRQVSCSSDVKSSKADDETSLFSDWQVESEPPAQAKNGIISAHFDGFSCLSKVTEYPDIESGIPPSMPHVTPREQFLHCSPLVDLDLETASDTGEHMFESSDLALKRCEAIAAKVIVPPITPDVVNGGNRYPDEHQPSNVFNGSYADHATALAICNRSMDDQTNQDRLFARDSTPLEAIGSSMRQRHNRNESHSNIVPRERATGALTRVAVTGQEHPTVSGQVSRSQHRSTTEL